MKRQVLRNLKNYKDKNLKNVQKTKYFDVRQFSIDKKTESIKKKCEKLNFYNLIAVIDT